MSNSFSVSNLGNYDVQVDFNTISNMLRETMHEQISFSNTYKNCCVGIVDITNSTQITAQLQIEKMCKYYSIFLNSMSSIVKAFGGRVVKNIGDSLLYYFPETCDGKSRMEFINMLECNLIMIESNKIINELMCKEELPKIDYRISIDYGNLMIAKSSNSSNEDVFGSTVNLCAKINSKAMSNTIVIGSDLYQIVRPLHMYQFKMISDYFIGLKFSYPIYSIQRKTHILN